MSDDRTDTAREIVAERWRPIKGYGGKYKVSDMGRVRSMFALPMSPSERPDGYLTVRLMDGDHRKVLRIHRLVAAAFIPNPGRKPYVNHIDNNPANNCAANLEWCTQRENVAHARRQGRMADDYWRGKRSPNALLTDVQVAAIRAHFKAGLSFMTIARLVGTNKKTAMRVAKGETYV